MNGSAGDTKIAATMYTASCNRSEYTEDVDRAVGFALAMEDGDAIIIGNNDCDGELVCISSDKGRPRLSWQVLGAPYWFNAKAPVSWPSAVHAVRVFQDQGIRGAQALCEWELAETSDENTGSKTFHLPLVLRRALSNVIRAGNSEQV